LNELIGLIAVTSELLADAKGIILKSTHKSSCLCREKALTYFYLNSKALHKQKL
jgi:hypothetical protein